MNLDAGITLDRWTSLEAGTLPCASCGIRVAVPADNFGNEDVELLQIFGHDNRPHATPPQKDFAVTRCARCRMIRQSALDLLSGNPAVRQRIGSAEIALHRLEAALCGLDAIGTTDARTIDRLTDTGADLTRLMDALTVVGGLARWAAHVRAAEFTRAASMPAPHARWGHVTPEQRQALRNAAGHLLARRVEKPVDVLCPSENGSPSGCMLCGVRAVEARREDIDYVWTLMSADAVTIGGRPQPESLDGVVCPRCDRAIDEARGVGASAMRLSVRSLLGVPSHLRSLDDIDGLIGWAALPLGTSPNRAPWDHIDLSVVQAEATGILGRAS